MDKAVCTAPREWKLKRNCSLAPRQFALAWLLLASLAATVSIASACHGAWPIFFTGGAYIVGVAAAFFKFARHAADYERIVLRSGEVVFETMEVTTLKTYRFNPAWVKAILVPDATGRQPETAFQYAGERVRFGKHIARDLRKPLADELNACFRHYR